MQRLLVRFPSVGAALLRLWHWHGAGKTNTVDLLPCRPSLSLVCAAASVMVGCVPSHLSLARGYPGIPASTRECGPLWPLPTRLSCALLWLVSCAMRAINVLPPALPVYRVGMGSRIGAVHGQAGPALRFIP